MSVASTPARRKPARTSQTQRNRKPLLPVHGVARLTLHINGTQYSVRPIACDPAAALKAIRLKKVDGTTYHIALTVTGMLAVKGGVS